MVCLDLVPGDNSMKKVVQAKKSIRKNKFPKGWKKIGKFSNLEHWGKGKSRIFYCHQTKKVIHMFKVKENV